MPIRDLLIAAVSCCVFLQFPSLGAAEFTVTSFESSTAPFRIFASQRGLFMAKSGELTWSDGFRIRSFDINSTDESAAPRDFIEFQNEVYFTAAATEFGREWFTWGGDVPVHATSLNNNPSGAASAFPTSPFLHRDRLYFFAHGENGNGRELHAFDGQSTYEAADIWTGRRSSASGDETYYYFDNQVLIGGLNHPSLRYPVYSFDGEKVALLGNRSYFGLVETAVPLGENDFVAMSSTFDSDTAEWDHIYHHSDGETISDINLSDVNCEDVTSFNNSVYYGCNQLLTYNGGEVRHVSTSPDISFLSMNWTTFDDKLLIWPTGSNQSWVMDSSEKFVEIDLFEDNETRIGKAFEYDGWLYLSARPQGDDISNAELFRTMDLVDFERIDFQGSDLSFGNVFETSIGLFYQGETNHGPAIYWTDGELVEEIRLPSQPQAFLYWEEALYVHVKNDGYYKIVRSDSIARVDYNRNGSVDAGDLDVQAEQFLSDLFFPAFDLNEDAVIDLEDRRLLVEEFGNSTFGDSNLDGVFDSFDLVLAFQAGTFEQRGKKSRWSDGDWNGDGTFTTGDLVLAFQSGGYERRASATVPEPPIHPMLFAILLFSYSSILGDRRPGE